MRAEEFEMLQRRMLAEISAATVHVSRVIGKTALDERVMTAMGEVPRHEFVPIELQPYAYATSNRLRQNNLAAIYCSFDDGST